MQKLLHEILGFFIPYECPACGKISADEVVCSECLSKIIKADKDRIEREYKRNFAHDKIVEDFTSLFIFEKDKEFQHIIHSLKYNKNLSMGLFLGEQLAKEKGKLISRWNIDLIIPVPLHKIREVERGYNQSYYISKAIANYLQIPLSTNTLKRIKSTSSQTMMNRVERMINIKDSFQSFHPEEISGKTILIVDDLITTGSTIQECGKILLSSGAKKVYAISVGLAN